ncbi:MAG: hypothetical protein KKB21_03400 [Nanoarchaeota archaeon]|nr:hypothetical protein [Nanoarchaeota archaeon]
MERKVEVSLEAFGSKKISALFTPEELKGKKVEDLVRTILAMSWQGEDSRTLAAIQTEMEARKGYVTKAGVYNATNPVKLQPIRLGDSIEPYVQQIGSPEERVRLSITGIHDVGS